MPLCMDKLSALLPKVLRKHGIKDEVDASWVTYKATAWLQKQSPDLSGVRASKLEGSTLFVEVPSSIAAQECAALREGLLEELRREFPSTRIETIRILREQKTPHASHKNENTY